MDTHPKSALVSDKILRIEEAKYTIQTVVQPVTLESKFISMLNSNQAIVGQATNTTDMTSSTTATTTPSPPPATTTAIPKQGQESQDVTSTTAPQSSMLPQTVSIVGGKQPPEDESPLIIHIQQQDDDEDTTKSDMPESDTSTNQLTQEQPLIRKQKPEGESTHLSTSERGSDLGRKRSKQGVQFSEVSPKRDVSDVMSFFQEQEKSLQERFLSLPKQSHKKQRSPSPKMQHAPGLEHLDNLIRLMEQLTSLKDENTKLRKRCDYLESTKILLQAKRDLSHESSSSSSGYMTLQPKNRQQHRHQNSSPDKGTIPPDLIVLQARDETTRITRPRISSAEELEYIEIPDSSSDQAPKKIKTAMHKRSFSTGSLEVPSEMSTDLRRVESRKIIKGKHGRSIFSRSSGPKHKTKNSKWARVKKVLTGQKFYEDLGSTIRTIRDLGRSTHGRYSTHGGDDFTSTTSRLSPGDTRPSETSSKQRHPDVYQANVPIDVRPALITETSLLRQKAVEDSELSSEIWMGPPDWWEEYEARKESGGTSSNSEVSSVIEVTTMYLGGKKDVPSTGTTTTNLSTSTTPAVLATTNTQEKYLSIEKPLPRRQSSPSLVMKESAEEDDILLELATGLESARILHKSSSCKSADLDLENLGEGRHGKKSHRSAWGRVKDIIHTRKDSIKKKPKRGKSGIDSEETSEIDVEGLLEEHCRSLVFDDDLLSRSTPRSSPMVIRQHSLAKGPSDLAGSTLRKVSPSRGAVSYPAASPPNMASLLAGSMSDEFNKKMQEWEQIRSKKSAYRVSMDESEISGLDVSHVSDLYDLRGKEPTSEGIAPDESSTSVEMSGAPSLNVEDIQRRMTGSFSRKIQEWERLKYRGTSLREPSPESERREIKGRKEERHKSKRSREEKEKEKWERQRERDIQKVEREQVKLEKEKLRIEKERLRALEREAKLEKLKGRLSQTESKQLYGPLAEYKVTADFARKLHEWEMKKGLSHDVSNSIYLEAQQMGIKHLRQEGHFDSLSKQEARIFTDRSSRSIAGSRTPPPPPLTLQPYWDSPEDTSPVERYSETSLGEGDDETCTSITEECLTKSNINTLERANRQLVENLQEKEMEYVAVQEEVRIVNEKLAKVRENHTTEMARFHHELAKGKFSGPLKLEVGELETTVGDLEQKIKLMESFGDKMASSMESAAIGKWQSIEGEETVHTQLVELVDQMRGMLLQASRSEEQSQKSMALSNFETLYSQAMKLQVQMNNLRLSHLERNREIMIIKRQLLLQEVNNLLLQADISRRETELYQFHEAKRFTSLKRWNTFSGAERQRPLSQSEMSASTSKPVQGYDSRLRPIDSPDINIPYIPEELMQPPMTSSSISAPTSPLCLAGTDAAPVSPPLSTAGQLLYSSGATYEQSTDRLETRLHLTPSLDRRKQQAQSAAVTHQPMKESTLTGTGQEQSSLLQLPKLYIHVQPKPHSPVQSLSSETKLTSPSQPSASTEQPSVVQTQKQSVDKPPLGAWSSREIGTRGTAIKIGITTICDSAPLHREITELRREKRKVERGPPTLKRSESEGLSAAPSPGKVPRQSPTPEAPDQAIPKQRSLDKPKLTKVAPIVDDDYFPEPSVMKCTDLTEMTDSKIGAVGGVSLQAQTAPMTGQDLPHTSDFSEASSVSSRSLGSKTKVPHQREEKENQSKENRGISTKSSPVAARGKPPLPRYAMSGKQSPSASTSSDKGPRSKSVSDVEDRRSDSTLSKPLQDVVRRFEKCATVCETEGRPVELRKTPSPTLHLPRVGLVSRVRRLKPAAELLEESHRYRSGHSICATRILQKYISKDEHKLDSSESTQDKENLSSSHAQTLVHHRLSSDSSPEPSRDSSRATSDISLKQSDSTQAQFITDKDSSNGRQSMPPFRDLTNERQMKKLTLVLSSHPSNRSQERTLSDSEIERQHSVPSTSGIKSQNRKSCEVAIVLSSATPMSETTYQMVSSLSSESPSECSPKAGSVLTPTSCQSLPTITMAGSGSEETSRDRAATYCVSETDQSHSKTIGSAPQQPLGHAGEKLQKSKRKSSKTKPELERPPSLSPERKGAGRTRMATVGVLCKQSISFDLGVSLYTHKSPTDEPKSRQARSWDPSESARAAAVAARVSGTTPSTAPVSPRDSTTSEAAAIGDICLASTSSEGDIVPSSPTSLEKKRSRRFFDSSWLQKSKKFFKVSK